MLTKVHDTGAYRTPKILVEVRVETIRTRSLERFELEESIFNLKISQRSIKGGHIYLMHDIARSNEVLQSE